MNELKIPTVAEHGTDPKATTVQVLPNSNIPLLQGTNFNPDNGWVAVGLSVVGAILFFRKRFFQDGQEIKKGKIENELLDTLLKQAENYKTELHEAWAAKSRLAETVAAQKQEIENLKTTVKVFKAVLEEIAPDKVRHFEHLLPKPTSEIK